MVNLCMLENIAFFPLLNFVKTNFSKKCFRNTIRVSNSWDPDQVQHIVEPDLVPIYLQRLSADDTAQLLGQAKYRNYSGCKFSNYFPEGEKQRH